MRILRAGKDARLIEVDDSLTMSLHAALSASDLPGVLDLVPGAATVLVVFDPTVMTESALDKAIGSLRLQTQGPPPIRPLEVPTTYDGPDLELVCRVLDMSRDEFVHWHTALEWTVAFNGFAPGFGYLISAEHSLSVPRRDSPRTRVPPGSVAMAAKYTAVYPRTSPGGWQIVGRTSRVLFDLAKSPPSEMVPGRVVRFIECSDPGAHAVSTPHSGTRT